MMQYHIHLHYVVWKVCCYENYHVINGKSVAQGERYIAEVDVFSKPLSLLLLKDHTQKHAMCRTER